MSSLDLFKSVKKASSGMVMLEVNQINHVLSDLASEAMAQTEQIIIENAKDLALMPTTDPKYDRLKLTKERIESIATEIKNVAKLEYPIGKILDHKKLPNGLELKKISVPLGVVGVIYEARPNVTFDVFALCLKSGNACLLKGGSDAHNSNSIIVSIIKKVIAKNNLDQNMIQLLPADRSATEEMLNADQYLDVIIPRGSQGLIDYVRKNSKVPVIETGAGIVHAYFDHSGDLQKGKDIINNSKTRRVSVCNSLDCLIINSSRLSDLSQLVAPLQQSNVIIYADELSFAALDGKYKYLQKTDSQSFGTEFLDYKMSIKTVSNINEAINHIAEYSSKHSECIISEDQKSIDLFMKMVDAAAVYANSSTAFTDGAQFGLGAEIGISTQKLHARGPMALAEITSYKWLVYGNGQIRG